MGTGPGLARQESAGRVFGRFWNRTDPFLRSKPGTLAGYPDPSLTLVRQQHSYGEHMEDKACMLYRGPREHIEKSQFRILPVHYRTAIA